jgi:hypothetical protein
MILFALVLVLIPFFSFPPFILTASYVQPLPLLLGWFILLVFNKVSLSRDLFLACMAYILFIFILKLGLYGLDDFNPADVSVLIAYIIGLLTFALFMGLFQRAEQMRISGNIAFYQLISKAIRLSALFVSASVILSISPLVSSLLVLIKPRSLELDEGGLAASLRGLSGIMPEPSYVGTSLAVLYLSLFILSLTSSSPDKKVTSLLFTQESGPNMHKFFLQAYTSCILSFLSRYIVDIILAVFAMFLTFSPTTLIVFSFISSLILLPYAIHLFLFIRVRGFLVRLLLLIIFVFSTFIAVSNFFFPNSRLASIIISVFSGDIGNTFLLDPSVADRYASSVIGLTGLFFYPLGVGLNGHGAIMSDCSTPIIVHLDLMCGSIFNSTRSHNAIAAVIVDGGVASLFLFLLFLKPAFRHSTLAGLTTLTVTKFLFPLAILFSFVLLPAPLGSPFVWLPLASSVQVLSGLTSSARLL